MVGSQSRVEASEYDAIESALAETERGRRFLAEHARRQRGADTDTLLRAMARLESAVTRDLGAAEAPGDLPDNLQADRHAAGHAASHTENHADLRADLAAMAEALARMRAEIAAMRLPDGPEEVFAEDALDLLVRGAERATAEILGAAEAMQEAAWGLRERGADGAACDVLDRRAVAIYQACSAQDLSAQRTGRAVATLRDLEARIAARLDPEKTPAAPRPLPEAFPPADDLAFVPSPAEPETVFDAAKAAPEPRPAAPAPAVGGSLADAFADLDRLSIEEKIALFS